MTTFLFVRHGNADAVGKRLVGRLPEIHLDAEGNEQVRQLALSFREIPLSAVCSSPLERALETAWPIAREQGIDVLPCKGFDEIDFGNWSGRMFDELKDEPGWHHFNTVRSCIRIPGGENISEVQTRLVGEIERLQEAYPSGTVAIVSHADVIRVALAYYAAIPVDLFLRIEVGPASISTLQLTACGPRILGINCRQPSFYE